METLGLKYDVQEDNQLKPSEQIHNGHFFQWLYQRDQNPSTKLNQNFFQPKPSEVIWGKCSKQQKPIESQNGEVLKPDEWRWNDEVQKWNNEQSGVGVKTKRRTGRGKGEWCSKAEWAGEETKKGRTKKWDLKRPVNFSPTRIESIR